MAPIERVKLVLQTQDLNPRIRCGEIPPYKGAQIPFTWLAVLQQPIWSLEIHELHVQMMLFVLC